MGGRRGLPGLSGVHTHMSNTRNTPVEAIEHYLPGAHPAVRVCGTDSGGAGAFAGGDGIVREYEVLTDTIGDAALRAAARSRRTACRAASPGGRGRNTLIRDGREQILPGKIELQLRPATACASKRPAAAATGSRG